MRLQIIVNGLGKALCMVMTEIISVNNLGMKREAKMRIEITYYPGNNGKVKVGRQSK